jgi:F0F1-type ATP synthase assembly protein I
MLTINTNLANVRAVYKFDIDQKRTTACSDLIKRLQQIPKMSNDQASSESQQRTQAMRKLQSRLVLYVCVFIVIFFLLAY